MPYFFIATPYKGDEDQTKLNILNNCLSHNGKSIGQLLSITVDKNKFKIGTLDSLMELNDSLGKIDMMLENTVRKVEKQAREITADEDFKIMNNDGKFEVKDYIKQFRWDDMRLPRSKSLDDIAKALQDKMKSIDNDMKKQIDEFNDIKSQCNQFVKKEGKNYATRDLGDVIYGKADKDKFVESDYLTTIVCIVHKTKLQGFQESYENLTKDVVPRTAARLLEDDSDGYSVWRVITLQHAAEDFVKESRKANFTAKRFTYNAQQYEADQLKKSQLEQKLEYQKNVLSSRLFYAFSELYQFFIHLRVMRTYIDGVLRFGIPPKFLLTVMVLEKNKDKQAITALIKEFADPNMSDMYGSKEEVGDSEDFYPFVLLPLNTPANLF